MLGIGDHMVITIKKGKQGARAAAVCDALLAARTAGRPCRAFTWPGSSPAAFGVIALHESARQHVAVPHP